MRLIQITRYSNVGMKARLKHLMCLLHTSFDAAMKRCANHGLVLLDLISCVNGIHTWPNLHNCFRGSKVVMNAIVK